MKTQNIISLVAVCFSINASAQDIITKNDSSKLNTKIIEIGNAQIKYKLFNYIEGPLYITNKSEIAYIIFSNGSVEKINKTSTSNSYYNPNKYNLDAETVPTNYYHKKPKDYSHLYNKKNYIGFNYVSFLNGALGFNYMHDFKKFNTIISVPFAFGIGDPAITNDLYSNSQNWSYQTRTIYNNMNYQAGINVLFSPSMNGPVNFLMGPAYNFTEFNASSKTMAYQPSTSTTPGSTITYSNDFKLYRQHFGVTVGFLARFTSRINMNMQLTLGTAKDSYSKKDPFGYEYFTSLPNVYIEKRRGSQPYANFLWSIGYRF